MQEKMNVPFLDLQASYVELKAGIDEAVSRVLSSGSYILGSEVLSFEEEWADYCQAGYAVGVGNGLDALVLSLRALGIGPGDEVIVPSHTFVATWLAVIAVGAKLVPIEPNALTFNIDASQVASAITPATRVIIPVHLYGQPADLDPLLQLARRHGIYIIEDAAQAHGAFYKGRRIGSHGDLVCWSFYPGKNLGAFGDGGAITTNNSELAERVKILRNYGSREKYLNLLPGVNSRLDPLQAAILRVKLPLLDEWNERRKAIASEYLSALSGCGLILPSVPSWADPVWHLFVVRSPLRASIQRHLSSCGVGTLIHYPVPPHRQKAFSGLGLSMVLPAADQLAAEVFSLPIGPHLARHQVEMVVKCLENIN